jgi:hypothetical protein
MTAPLEIDGVKIFSATTAQDRNDLGTRVTAWLAQHADFEIVEKRVLQSSDEKFHCVTIVLFYTEPH